MKNKNIVLLALAIGCGLVAAFLTAKLGASNKTEMIPVLVAAKNIDQGTKLDEPEKLFVRKPFPRESVPPEFIDDVNQLRGQILQRTIRAGTHCTVADITHKTSIDLPVGADGTMYKGMAIKVSQHTAVSGFVQPGDRVDVLVVERLINGKTTSTTLLQDVLVVAINEMNIKPEGGPAIKNAATVTLAVKQKEGSMLALAQARGELTLMLRSKDDKTTTRQKSIENYNDQKDDAGANGSAAAAAETVKVPVAKADIAPGTKVGDPSDLFEEKELPEAALTEQTIRDLAELKGKTLTKHAYAGMPVPKAVIEGELPKAPEAPVVVARDAVKGHTMIIQVGTQAPQFVKYDDKGRLLEGNQPINSGAAPAPEKSGGSAEIKPEPKAIKDKDD